MSVQTVRTSQYSLVPCVQIDKDRLQSRTSLLVQLLTLFSYCHRVSIDRREHLVDISTRYLWVLRRRQIIHFKQISHLRYQYSAQGTSWGMTGEGYGQHDKWETFTISLVLARPPGEQILFRFSGAGSVETGWVGVLAGDSLIDYEGDQEDASLAVVQHLSRLLDVPIGRPADPVAKTTGSGNETQGETCPTCGRPRPLSRKTCLYCGAPLPDRSIPGLDP